MNAYDIAMLTRPANRADPADRGWCFGLPPGITPEQWPLDPVSGYPLMHGFTILLPEDYRCHGPDIVAMSFFATECHGSEASGDEVLVAVFEPDAAEPDDPDLAVFWRAERSRHPRLHRMWDLVDCAHALILLDQAEYEGALCRPPAMPPNRYRNETERPPWLDIGSASAFWQQTYSPRSNLAAEEYFIFRALGQIPEDDLSFDRAIRWTPRANDPNAGIPTCDAFDKLQTGYRGRYCWDDGPNGMENFREQDWAVDHATSHIGGTMRACQGVPRLSPYYIGFDELLGGYNFGGGSAQLDFKDMKLDWACG